MVKKGFSTFTGYVGYKKFRKPTYLFLFLAWSQSKSCLVNTTLWLVSSDFSHFWNTSAIFPSMWNL